MMEASTIIGDFGDSIVSGIATPRLCCTCAYHRFVKPVIGREDMPRLKGPYRNGHSQPPCTLCSANPRYELLYSSDGGTRRLKVLGETNLIRLKREI